MSSDDESAGWESEVSSSESSDLSDDDGVFLESLDQMQSPDHSAPSSEVSRPGNAQKISDEEQVEKKILSTDVVRQSQPVASAAVPVKDPLPPKPAPLPNDIATIAHGNLNHEESKQLESSSENLEDPLLEIPNTKIFVILRNRKHLAHSGTLRVYMTSFLGDCDGASTESAAPSPGTAVSYVLEVGGWRYRLRAQATACMAMSDRHYVLNSGVPSKHAQRAAYFGLVMAPSAVGEGWEEERLALEDILTDNTTYTVRPSFCISISHASLFVDCLTSLGFLCSRCISSG